MNCFVEVNSDTLKKVLSNFAFMDIKCEHDFIIGKKISPFARAVTEIFNFFFGEVTFGSSCILIVAR